MYPYDDLSFSVSSVNSISSCRMSAGLGEDVVQVLPVFAISE